MPNKFQRAAHSLKGAVSNLAAERAQEAAFAIEVMGRENNLGGIPQAWDKLESEMSAARAAIEELLKEG